MKHFLRLTIALIALATLIASSLAVVGHAQAQPLMVERIVPGAVRISGFIPDSDGTYNIPCASFNVSLVELKPPKRTQTSGQFEIPIEVLLASSAAINDTVGGTCQYELKFAQPSAAIRYAVPRTYIVKIKGGGYQGQYIHTTQSPIPTDSLFNVKVYPEPVIR